MSTREDTVERWWQAVFRVRVGAFADRAQADSYKQKLAMPAFIVRE